MTTAIERVRYYESQYLRSHDFTAEQAYHVEMRRRLNLALHLSGLVEGLELVKGPTEPGLPDQVYVTPGLAIDGYGREIVRFSNFALDEEVLADNKITTPGTYAVYVEYRRELGTPPAPGDRVCNVQDQYTRWLESGRVFLSNSTTPPAPIALTDALPDDPQLAPWPVRLGSIAVAAGAGGRLYAQDINPLKPGERSYVGVRAQHLVAPAASAAANEKEKLLPIRAEADLRAVQNLIVGTDFEVTKADVEPAPSEPPTFPGTAGNVRVDRHIFLRGNLYQQQVDGKWLALPELVLSLCKQLIPEIKTVSALEVPTLASAASPPNNTVALPAALLTSDLLAKPSKASVMVSLSGVEWLGKGDLDANWWNKLPASSPPLHASVSVGAITKKAGTDNQFEGNLSWSVSPKTTAANPADERIPISKLFVNVIVVFHP